MRGQLDPQSPAQRLDPGLGDGVGRVAHAVGEGIDGGDDDHLPAPLDDLGQRRAGGSPDAQQVDLKDAFPLLAGDPARGRELGLRDPRIGYGDVEPAELLHGLGDRREHRPLVGDVGGDPDRPRADPLRRLARLGRIEVEHRHRGPPEVHMVGGLEADSPGGTGYQRHLPVQVIGHGPEPTRPFIESTKCPAFSP